MTTRISTAAAAAALDAAGKASIDAVVARLDAGAAAGYVEIRTGTQPATVGDAATGTLLATATLGDPAFGAATGSGGTYTATAAAITSDASADADGEAGWWRAYDSDDTPIIDGAAGETGSGAEMILTDATVTTGGTFAIDSWTVSRTVS